MEPTQSAEGPSFPPSFKLLATIGMLVLLVASVGLARHPAIQAMPPAYMWLAGFMGLVVAGGYLQLMRARTSIDGSRIRQQGLWGQEVLIAEISRVKLIHVKGLAWLVAPRLIVRTGGFGMHTFHAADPQVLQAFRRLAYGGD